MDLNRREALKSGAAGFLLGFLFRGRDGKLSEQPEVVDQPPSAITIRTMPQKAFRPSRLVIAGTVVGKQWVPETRLVPCDACADRHDRARLKADDDADDDDDDEDEYEDDDYYPCEACNGLGDKIVKTGEMVERDVTIVPWSIESMTIGARSQIAEAGAIPGDMFSAGSFDSLVSFDAAGAGQEIEIVVRYTGDDPEGAVFRGALIGTTIGKDGVPRQAILPISSAQKIVA